MHIFIAPNAFKGSLSATDAAKAIAEGLHESKLNCETTLFPIADGGDGTAFLLNQYWKAEIISVPVHDPLGRMITASFGWVQDENKAIIGISDASGIKLLQKSNLSPLHANTFGTGELIKAALDKGAEKIIVGVGGSATVDGGTGLLKALGMQYFDKGGNEIHDLPLGLLKLSRINIVQMHKRSLQVDIVVLCDVQNKLLGSEGAARIFGPQKGADDEGITLLEQCMKQWNDMTLLTMQRTMATLKYGGAAGGIAAGLAAYTKAKLVSGIDYFLSEANFEALLQQADLVLTGEGSIDEQTLEGKGPFGIACMAKKKDIPVIGMAGQIKVSPQSDLYQYFRELIAINPPDMALANAIKNTSVNLKKASVKLGNSLATFCACIMTVWLLSFPFINSYSQSQTTGKSYKDTSVLKNTLSEIVISAYEQNKAITRQPAALFYLSPVEINRFNPASIVSAVNIIPGVQMQQRSPQSYRLNIRGSALVSPFGVRNVKIYYNGIPLTDPGGGTYLNELSPEDMNSLTIIKGPGASFYGAGTGGVVLIDGPLFSDDSLRNSAKISLEGGSYGLQRMAAALTWGDSKQKSQIRYAGMSDNGYREQTAMHEKMLAYETVFKKGDKQQLSVTAHYTDLYYQIPGALTLSEYKANPKAARPAVGSLPSAEGNKTAVFQKNFLLGLNEQYRFSNHLQSNFILYGAYTDIVNPTIFNYEYRKEPHFGGRLTFNGNYQTGHAQASFWIGGELQQGYFNVTDNQNINGVAGNMMTDDNVNNFLSMAFAQADFSLPKGWDITVGGSFHHATVNFTQIFPAPVANIKLDYDHAVSPRIAISKELGGNRIVYVNVSSGYSPPTVSQLLPSTSVINTSLHPETGVDYEIGSRGLLLDQKLYYDIDAFVFNLTKSIATRRDSSGQDYFVNAGGTKQHGIEAYLSYPVISQHKNSLKAWISTSWFDFRYLNYEVTGKDYSGNKLPGTSPFTFVGGLDYNLNKRLAAHVTYTYNDRIPLDDANDVFAASYNLLDFRIDYNTHISRKLNLTLLGGLNNLLNKKYSLGNDINVTGGRYYNAAPGRNFYISAILKFDKAAKKSRN